MARYDFRTTRLFVPAPLGAGSEVALDEAQANYLLNVLRLSAGDPVLAFNGREGEWRCALVRAGKRKAALSVTERTREQTQAADLHYLFAPLKAARLDYMVQKAVECGAARLQPVITRHTQAARVNVERMAANAIEAAEQCGILTVAQACEPLSLEKALAALEQERTLVFCDEDAELRDPVAALAQARRDGGYPPLAVLIGPEGGFAAEERALVLARGHVVRLALGPRILRADTAAVAALALVQSVLGDWA
jgi:16S rRNA (uracil1498-N3)-methyltransferase